MIPSPILFTKIIPPQLTKRTLQRARLTEKLQECFQYRITMMQAGAGYGKSTALISFTEMQPPPIWYQVSREDSDPLVFLQYLCHATLHAIPDIEQLPIELLDNWDGTRGPLPTTDVVYRYLNALTLHTQKKKILILDDAHLISENDEILRMLDILINQAPPGFHILLSSRYPIRLPSLSRWRARGDIFQLDQADLAFTPAEIAVLFSRNYAYELTPDEAETLFKATEGWAITLPLIWQALRSGGAATIEEALTQQHTSLQSLFDILADEVFALQPPDVQAFLEASATLQAMTAAACDALRAASDSDEMLAYLQREELFIIEESDKNQRGGEGPRLRYQHVFHHFLRQRADHLKNKPAWHRTAAAYFVEQQEYAQAIYHHFKAGDELGAAEILATYGRSLIVSGRLDTLAGYLNDLPPHALHQFPVLLTYLGDLTRLHSRFEEALDWYKQAESVWRERGNREGVARALRGQARIYLDTVNPKQAEEILQETLHMSDGLADRESQARLYELLAENKLNSGKADEAERLREQASELREEGPHESQLLYRVLLRTGQLTEARQKLETQAEAERHKPIQTPRAHRETQLLLSIIYAFFGEAEAALQAAVEGTQRGVELESPFITAVGHMRQGHALLLLPGDDRGEKARARFEKTIEISRTLAIPRLVVEANWGLCRLYGYRGDITKAREVAEEGIRIASEAGDEWIASLIRLAMGASMTLATRYEAARAWLNEALLGFRECSDPFQQAAANLWLCLGYFQQGMFEPLQQVLPTLLAVSKTQGYHFLYTCTTLTGLPDERLLIPMLLHAREHNWEAQFIQEILTQLGLADIRIHPGYQLRVSTLGKFQVWRGSQLIEDNGWQRTSARTLFQILLTYRETLLTKEQIFEFLWADEEPDAMQRNFKAAMNTLNRVLEPDRERNAESAFIQRQGSSYQLRPEADIWLDAQQLFDSLSQAETEKEIISPEGIAQLEIILALYQGEYLPEARYETWASVIRERLAVAFLRSADRLCEAYLDSKNYEAVIAVCQTILAHDNCWERAYRYMMTAYDRLGDHGQVARIYARCVSVLQEELEVTPSPETETLFQSITSIAG